MNKPQVLFVATDKKYTSPKVATEIQAFIESNWNYLSNYCSGIVDSSGELNELQTLIKEAYDAGKIEEAVRAFKVEINVTISEL